jgi:hypothetical protein
VTKQTAEEQVGAIVPFRSSLPVGRAPGGALVPRARDELDVDAGRNGTVIHTAHWTEHRRGGRGRRSRRTLAAMLGAAVLALGALAAALVSGTTGHGAGTLPPGHRAPAGLVVAASQSVAAKTASYTYSAALTGDESTVTLVTGRGSVDLLHGVARTTAGMPALTTLVGPRAAGALTIVTHGGTVYVAVPALSPLLGGRTWFKTSVPGASSLGSPTAMALASAALAEPGALLDLVATSGAHVTDHGAVQLQGAPATEYTVGLPVATVLDLAHHGASGSNAAGAGPSGTASAALRRLDATTVPVTVWVGADGKVHQLRFALGFTATVATALFGSPASSTVSHTAAVEVTVGLSGYGAPVSAAVPPAASVASGSTIVAELRTAADRVGGAVSAVAGRL